MKGQFYLHFDKMPTGTAQQKGVRVVHGKPYFYTKPNVEGAETLFKTALIPHLPKKPSDKPIRLTVTFCFDTKKKKLWGQPKPTRPDTDNYLKLFKDCLTADKNGRNGLWFDDAQVVEEHVFKNYAEKATIAVYWEEVLEDADSK